MRRQGLPLTRMLTTEALMAIARDLHLADVASLYAAVGESQVSAQSVVQRLVAGYGGEEGAVEDIAETAVATRPRGRVRRPTTRAWSSGASATSGSSWPAAVRRCRVTRCSGS
ncbi:hypothetical protein Prum_017260 [Phytohabitans rumicis]|uniref:Uncharacterized protein n=1 Tax=Phytohabitans rumicis TaxID=1076125 RepID=A0A6V8KW76_9ACTN|nr:hypothetical protein Prum_017260 [Phytohabitans rumicis]